MQTICNNKFCIKYIFAFIKIFFIKNYEKTKTKKKQKIINKINK